MSALPISASAAYTQSLTVNFGFDCTIYDSVAVYPEEVKAAMKSLVFEFMDTNENDCTYDYDGNAFSVTVVDSDLNSWDIRITNPSHYEFYFDLRIPSDGPSFGKMTIPACSPDGSTPGVYTLDLSTIFAQVPAATKLTFWVRLSFVPEYMGYNTNVAAINFYTPDGLYSSQQFSKPDMVGTYSVDFDEAVALGLSVPDVLDGYLLDESTLPSTITVSPYVVKEYDIYYVDKVNGGVTTFYAELPSGENVLLGEIRPPDTHVGAYSFVYADVMDYFELDDWQIEALSGYEIDSSLFNINTTYTIYDDAVNEVFIPYRVTSSTARTLRFELYDVNGAFLKSETVKVVSSALTCNTPLYGDFDVFPYSVNIDVSKSVDEVQVFKCYAVNIYEIRSESYEQGHKDGFALGQASSSNDGEIWQEGYDEGLADGLKQNKLTAEQIQHYTKDYNAITAFFDGMFGWMKDMFFDLGAGIEYKGVRAIDIFASVIIIAVVIWGYKTLF